MFFGRREHVDDSAADGELTAPFDQVHARVGSRRQLVHQIVDGQLVPGVDAHRLQLREPGHLRLQHAAGRRYDHLERARALVAVVLGVHQPAQHGQAPANGVAAR